LSKTSWQEVFLETGINAKFEAFMRSVQHSFDTAFTLKLMHKRKSLKNGWITKGIEISSKKNEFLSILKKQPNLTEEVLMYIAKYRMIYRQ
jgi:hypothetical protein